MDLIVQRFLRVKKFIKRSTLCKLSLKLKNNKEGRALDNFLRKLPFVRVQEARKFKRGTKI